MRTVFSFESMMNPPRDEILRVVNPPPAICRRRTANGGA
jgi:hypothetical protein